MAYGASGIKSVADTDDSSIDGILDLYRWSSSTLTYGAPVTSSDYGFSYSADLDGDGTPTNRDGFSSLDSNQFKALKKILDSDYSGANAAHAGFSVEGFSKLEFDLEANNPANAVIKVGNTGETAGAFGYLPGTTAMSGDVWLGGVGDKPKDGNYDMMGLRHEIGHALGLTHPHEDNGYGAVPGKYDTREYTVISYSSYVGQGPADNTLVDGWSEPQSYMMLDIAALQHMYGANYSTNAGDTVYKWTPSNGKTKVDGEVAINPGDNRIYATIWDGDGKDTFDLSAYDTRLKVDLRPGRYSVFSEDQLAQIGGDKNDGLARGNIFNAMLHDGDERSLIENAIGGDNNDQLYGNQARNELEGGKGNDRLKGYDEKDKLHGASGKDTLDGGNGDDRLYGDGGRDVLIGGKGADVLRGGSGNDIFRFKSASHSSKSKSDVIRADGSTNAFEGAGKADGDLIDLSSIDANTGKGGDQAFSFGTSKGRGELWLRNVGGDTVVYANTDRDDQPEFRLYLDDGRVMASDYTADDFIL